PHHVLRDPLPAHEGAEPTIYTRNDPLPIANGGDHRLNSLSHDLRMFNHVALRIDYTCYQSPIVRQLVLTDCGVLVLLARTTELEAERPDLRLIQSGQDDLHGHVVHMRTFPVAPAHMEPHAIGGKALDS